MCSLRGCGCVCPTLCSAVGLSQTFSVTVQVTRVFLAGVLLFTDALFSLSLRDEIWKVLVNIFMGRQFEGECHHPK